MVVISFSHMRFQIAQIDCLLHHSQGIQRHLEWFAKSHSLACNSAAKRNAFIRDKYALQKYCRFPTAAAADLSLEEQLVAAIRTDDLMRTISIIVAKKKKAGTVCTHVSLSSFHPMFKTAANCRCDLSVFVPCERRF